MAIATKLQRPNRKIRQRLLYRLEQLRFHELQLGQHDLARRKNLQCPPLNLAHTGLRGQMRPDSLLPRLGEQLPGLDRCVPLLLDHAVEYRRNLRCVDPGPTRLRDLAQIIGFIVLAHKLDCRLPDPNCRAKRIRFFSASFFKPKLQFLSRDWLPLGSATRNQIDSKSARKCPQAEPELHRFHKPSSDQKQ